MATLLSGITNASPIDFPSHGTIARDLNSGYLYAAFGTSTAGQLALYRSVNGGTSWATYANFTRTGFTEGISSIVVDKHNWLHLAYLVNESSQDKIYYKRLNLTNATWGTELLVAADGNGGSARSVWQGLDLAVVRHQAGTYAIAVPAFKTEGTTRYGVVAHGVSIDASGTVYSNNGIVIGNREWWEYGTSPGTTVPACELEHNGDGFTSATPNLWVAWGRTKMHMVKLSWQGTNVGWQGPASAQVIDPVIAATPAATARWDGSRFLMITIDDVTPSTAIIYERNQANTGPTSFIFTPVHPQGVMRGVGASYDAVTKNLRIYGVGTSNDTLYYVDYTRATQTWGSWTQVSTDALVTYDDFSLKRGGSYGNARHDLLYAQFVAGPAHVVKHVAQTVGYAPNTPTWDTSGTPYVNGGAADVNASLLLDWTFTDQDPADAQTAYALRRQIGAGSIQYYTAAGGTWGGTEVFNATATTSVTLASSWGAGSDANHQYAVKVRDTATQDSGYSAALTLIASVKVNPAITAPTAAQVLATDHVTVTWTAGEQKTRRLVLKNAASETVYDSGFVATADLSYTIPYVLANGTSWTVELTTTNNEGLASTTQTRAFSISYTSPPASVSTVTAVPASGWLAVVGSNLSPVGVQPAIASQDLYRRVKLAANLTSNPSMAGNVTGWTGVGTTSMVYSTSQFHDSLGAAFATPTGAAALSLVRHTALIDVTAGAFYHASGWIRPTTSNKPVLINLDWYTSGSVFVSSTTVTINAVGGAWQYLEVIGAPVPTGAKVTMSVGESGTPAAGDTFYADELKLRVYDDTLGTPVATNLAAGATVNDWGAAGATDYEYRWYTVGSNGAALWGPWSG